MERILDEKLVKGKTQYLIKWQGYDDQTWEPASHMAKTEALLEWKKRKPTKQSASKTPVKGKDSEVENESGDDSESGGGEWKPKQKANSEGRRKTPTGAAKGKSPVTAAGPKFGAKRPLEEKEELPETIDADTILSYIDAWDAPALKALASAIAKEANGGHKWNPPLGGLKGSGKKGEVLEDITVAVRAVYAGMGTRERGRPYYFSGDAPPPEATFRSERIESTRLTFGATPATLRGAVEKSFRRAHEAAANSKAQKAFRPETKALMQRLQVLEQAQLAQVCGKRGPAFSHSPHTAHRHTASARPSRQPRACR